MRIQFPLELSVGTDLVACNRILNPANPNPGHLRRLTTRFLHQNEFRNLDNRFPGWREIDKLPEEQRRRVSSWLAGRWAAKEAAKKAWGASLLSWKDLRVEPAEAGPVHIICCPPNMSSTVMEQVAKLSISHDADYAIATVLATPLHNDLLAELGRRTTDAEAKVKERRVWVNVFGYNYCYK